MPMQRDPGLPEWPSVHGITVVPLKEETGNKMVYVKREDADLSQSVLKISLPSCEAYFDKKKVN